MAYYQKYFDGVDRLIDAFEDALPDDVRTLFVKRCRRGKRVTRPRFDSRLLGSFRLGK